MRIEIANRWKSLHTFLLEHGRDVLGFIMLYTSFGWFLFGWSVLGEASWLVIIPLPFIGLVVFGSTGYKVLSYWTGVLFIIALLLVYYEFL